MLSNFSSIKVFVFDIDGVLANDALLVSETGDLLRMMNSKDGYALQLAIKKGYKVAIISGGDSQPVKVRLERLGIKDIFLSVTNKIEKLQSYIKDSGFSLSEVLYMGDDIPDHACMLVVGFPCCPADAAAEIKEISKYISHAAGGKGCARDVIEKVLKLNGHWGLDATIASK